MNRIFYDGQATQGAGGNGENWRPICSKTQEACPQLCGVTGFCQNKQEEKSIKAETHSGWDWFCPPCFPKEPGAYICVVSKYGDHPILALNLKLRYLEYVEGEDNFRGLEEGEYVARWLGKVYAPASPGPKWVKASERSPSKRTNCFVMVYAPLFQYNYKATRLWDGNRWIDEIDGRTDPVVEWLEESPSLPGEQAKPANPPLDKDIPLRDSTIDNPDGSASYEKWLDQPGLERGEQVEGKAEALDPCVCSYAGEGSQYCAYPKCERIREDMARMADPKAAPRLAFKEQELTPPSADADQQDARKRGLKAFGDSMKNTLGEIIEPEENPFAHNEEIECLKAEVEAYKKTATLMGEEVNILRSSGQIALSEYKRDMEIVKGERDGLIRDMKDLHSLLNTLKEGYGDNFTEYFMDRINEALNKFTNNKDNEKGGQAVNI